MFIAGIYMTKNPCNNSGDTNNKNDLSNSSCNSKNNDNSHHGSQDNNHNTVAGVASRRSCGHKEGCCLAMLPGAAPTALPSRSGAECASVISLLIIAAIIVRKVVPAKPWAEEFLLHSEILKNLMIRMPMVTPERH